MQIMDNNPIVKATMAHLLHTAFSENYVKNNFLVNKSQNKVKEVGEGIFFYFKEKNMPIVTSNKLEQN